RLLSVLFYFFSSPGDPRPLHSFPTRRSSDLAVRGAGRGGDRRGGLRDDFAGAACRLLPARAARASVRDLLRRDPDRLGAGVRGGDRKSTRLNSSHVKISYAVFCLKKKKKKQR